MEGPAGKPAPAAGKGYAGPSEKINSKKMRRVEKKNLYGTGNFYKLVAPKPGQPAR
jgi:hypothetical protein